MFFPLLFITVIASFAAFTAAKGERKGLKLGLSLVLSFLTAAVMYALPAALAATPTLLLSVSWNTLLLVFTILPAAAFIMFQLLLYNIKLMG
ncbi:hypothetical protein [Alteribacter natronophilus]|uniref:hypothetical protein n=1 Tax=Alteribacter natronophilus TaxID=2583810 RepID=UPI00110ED19F|nr:hypothetical protein [Alteribacter natronophilus]TMW71044.1 hypothetical protein FGB90_13830 [Alteribacter natronophilus]